MPYLPEAGPPLERLPEHRVQAARVRGPTASGRFSSSACLVRLLLICVQPSGTFAAGARGEPQEAHQEARYRLGHRTRVVFGRFLVGVPAQTTRRSRSSGGRSCPILSGHSGAWPASSRSIRRTRFLSTARQAAPSFAATSSARRAGVFHRSRGGLCQGEAA